MPLLVAVTHILRDIFHVEPPRCDLCGRELGTPGPSGFCATCDEVVAIEPG